MLFCMLYDFKYLSSCFYKELEVEKEMEECTEPLPVPISQTMAEDYSDIDCHKIISIAGMIRMR